MQRTNTVAAHHEPSKAHTIQQAAHWDLQGH